MYALPNKTQQKLIAKVRGGISQKLDNFSSSPTSSSIGIGSIGGLASASGFASPLSASSSFKPVPNRELDLGRHLDEAGFNEKTNHLPQPVFHSINQHGGKPKSSSQHQKAQKHYITPEHNEMIKYVQQSWKGVERDYKKSVNNYINKLDFNGSSSSQSHIKQIQPQANKKTATTSSPLLLSGSYHHSSGSKDSSSTRQDSFQPFDLETFWGDRILKRLTEEL